MRKVIRIIVASIVILATIGLAVGVFLYTHQDIWHKVDGIDIYVHEENGFKYTEASWTWKPIENRKLIEYVDSSSLSKQYVSLCLSDTEYVSIAIPNKDYIYDFGKTLYAVDGSFAVRIIGDVTMDNLSSYAGIDNGVNINQLTLATPDKQKGKRTVCTLVGSYAIIADIYSGEDNYSILRDSLTKKVESYTIDEVPVSENATRLDEITYVGNYLPQVIFSDIDLAQRKYMFEDGSLWTQSVIKNMTDTKTEYLAKMYAATHTPIEEYYSDAGIYYAKSGDYYLGLMVYNSNTTIALLGSGEEAKCNIINIMSSLR